MKKLFLFSVLVPLLVCSAFAQGGPGQSNYPVSMTLGSGAPSGNCPATNTQYTNTSNGNLYSCPVAGSAWALTSGGGVLPTGVAAGSQLVSTVAGGPPAYQYKLLVDMRDASIAAGSAGVKCDGATDDTAAIQAYFNYYGHSGAGSNLHTKLQFPVGVCKITDTLTYEGDNSTGIGIVGQQGYSAGTNTLFAWYGPNFGNMFLILGCQGCMMRDFDIWANLSGNGGGKAQNIVWVDATNDVTNTAYNLSAITRSGNIVTATTSAAHAITSGLIVKVAASTGGAKSFNGTFRVLYANDTTHVSWIQTGGNESGTASTGTVTLYQSTPSTNFAMERVELSSPESVSTTISTISSGASPYTVTTTTAHFVNLGDTVISRAASDATYDCPLMVLSVPTSTTLTAIPLPGSQCAPDNAGSSGGTLLSGSSALRFAHKSVSTTEEVATMRGTDVFCQGDQLGGSVDCFRADNVGNVKDFLFNNIIAAGSRYGFSGFNSGNFNVSVYNGTLLSPDTTIPALASIDFVNNGGQALIFGSEVEASTDRFWANAGGNNGSAGSSVHIDGLSFQSGGPTDDIVISFAGSMVLTNSALENTRAAGATPRIQCGALQLVSSPACSFVSLGNFYANTYTGGSWSCLGFVPLEDGSTNMFCPVAASSFNTNKTLNVTSLGDQGSPTDTFSGTSGALHPVIPALIESSNCTSATSPAVCASATTGAVVLAAAATTIVVNTTAVSASANQQIFLTQDTSTTMGTRLGVTCNTTADLGVVSARVTATSFTITGTAPTTNPACYQFHIMNY
jgi:hypothetical protein